MIPWHMLSPVEAALQHALLTNTEGNVLCSCMSYDGTRAFITTSNGKLISYGKTAGVWTKRTTYTLPNIPLRDASVGIADGFGCIVVAAVNDDSTRRGQLNFFSYDTSTDTFTSVLDLSRATWASSIRVAAQDPVAVAPNGASVFMQSRTGAGPFPRRELITRPGGPTSWTGSSLTYIEYTGSCAIADTDTAYLQETNAGTVLRVTGLAARTLVTQATYTRSGNPPTYGSSISSSKDGLRVAITDPATANGYLEVRHSDAVVFSMVGANLPMPSGGDFLAAAARLSMDGNMLIVPASFAGAPTQITSLHFYRWNGSSYVYQYTAQSPTSSGFDVLATSAVQGEMLQMSSDGRATLAVYGNTLRFFTI